MLKKKKKRKNWFSFTLYKKTYNPAKTASFKVEFLSTNEIISLGFLTKILKFDEIIRTISITVPHKK